MPDASQEIDDQAAAGRGQGCLFDMDWSPYIAWRRLTPSAPRLPTMGHENAVAVSHKAHVPARNIVSSENGPAVLPG